MTAGRVSTRLDERAGGRTAWLTIARPEKLNALDPPTIAALRAAASALHDDARLRAVVITGAGERA
ncbi:MAG TPA: enoyl-CoA hydratase/isomerase family protein, partial [Xanthobacteraceae bacterium]|nr:enoyl-CoA hydratase/isomerase family protein [Xanthobacteraceae bacterium]